MARAAPPLVAARLPVRDHPGMQNLTIDEPPAEIGSFVSSTDENLPMLPKRRTIMSFLMQRPRVWAA
jgi:hypothetical protein